jgi:hypothetical protein
MVVTTVVSIAGPAVVQRRFLVRYANEMSVDPFLPSQQFGHVQNAVRFIRFSDTDEQRIRPGARRRPCRPCIGQWRFTPTMFALDRHGPFS